MDVEGPRGARQDEPVSASTAAPSTLDFPDTAEPSPTRLEDRPGITLRTRNLKHSALFYAALLGHQVPIVRGAAHVTDWLTLRSDDAPVAAELILHFAVSDLRNAAQALGVKDPGKVLRGRDPDGRRIELRVETTRLR